MVRGAGSLNTHRQRFSACRQTMEYVSGWQEWGLCIGALLRFVLFWVEKKCLEHKITLLTGAHASKITVLFVDSIGHFHSRIHVCSFWKRIRWFSDMFSEPVPTPTDSPIYVSRNTLKTAIKIIARPASSSGGLNQMDQESGGQMTVILLLLAS